MTKRYFGHFWSALSTFAWNHPEWWVIVASALAWVAMLDHGLQRWRASGHDCGSFAGELTSFGLMITAMMLPLMLDPLRVTAFGSLRVRRHRAMAGFLVGYSGPWLVVGCLAAWMRGYPWAHAHGVAAGAFAAAAVWVLVPVRARMLMACHRIVPLSPTGLRADLACLRYGAMVGAGCAGSCGPLMVACTLTGHGLPAMIGGALLGVMERRASWPSVRPLLAGTMVLAVVYLIR